MCARGVGGFDREVNERARDDNCRGCDVDDFLNIIFGLLKVPTTRDAVRGKSTDRFQAANGLTRRDYYF